MTLGEIRQFLEGLAIISLKGADMKNPGAYDLGLRIAPHCPVPPVRLEV